MPQRVKPVTRLVGGSLSTSMTGVGVVGVTAQEVTGAGAHAVSVGVASSGSGSAVIPGAAYTLADATAGLPFVVTHPTAPQGTLTVTPVNTGNIGTYLSQSGRQLILDPGTYGGLSLTGNDMEVVLTTGVTTGDITIYGQRIVVKADPARTGTVRRFVVWEGAADLLMDGVNFSDDTASEQQCIFWPCQRCALINSRVRQVRWPVGAFPASLGGPTDIIVANNEIISFGTGAQNGQGPRFTSMQNFAFVDNRIYEEIPASGFRLHAGSASQRADNIYIGRNQFEGYFWQVWPVGDAATSDNTLGMGTVWIVDNNIYSPNNWFIRTNGGGTGRPALDDVSVDVIHITGNNLYSTGGIWPGVGDNDWTATISGNSVQSTTTAPAWSYQ